MRISKPPEVGFGKALRTLGGTFALGLGLGVGAAQAQAQGPSQAQPATQAQAPAPAPSQSAAPSQSPAVVEYLVSAGDTLSTIGHRLLENPHDWQQVQSLNQVRHERRLRVGSVLRIPAVLLKSQPAEASLSVVTGVVQVNGQSASAGQKVVESAVLSTGADGIVEIRLGDGSTLRMTPNSRLRLERLRRFHRDDLIEARTVLEQGRVEAQASGQRRKPLEIRTPFATAAVRGTGFRVGAQPERVVAEVLSGAIEWGAAKTVPSQTTPARPAPSRMAPSRAAPALPARATTVALNGGYGSSSDPKGNLVTEALLAAPDLSSLPAVVDQAQVRASFNPIASASQYRVQLFSDLTRRTLVQERLTSEPRIEFDSVSDGAVYLRVRALSAQRIEGLDRDGLLQVRARPFAPVPQPAPNRGVVFEPRAAVTWAGAADADAYQVQLALDEGFRQVIGEQTVTGATRVELPLSPGDQTKALRYWRVAGRNPRGGYLGPFSPPQTLRYYAPPASPVVRGDGVTSAQFEWTARAGQQYLLEIATEPGFAQARRVRTAQGVHEALGLAPGQYHARLATVHDDGVQTPFSPPVGFRINAAIGTGSGVPLRSGTGLPIHSP